MKKKIIPLNTSQGILHPDGNGQNSHDEPLTFSLSSVIVCPGLFMSCCCSPCKAVYLSLCVRRVFPFKAVAWVNDLQASRMAVSECVSVPMCLYLSIA